MQKRKDIIIARQNLQDECFATYAEKEKQIQSNCGDWFLFQETSFDNIQFIHCNYRLSEKKHIYIDIENEVLEMHFRLQGAGNIYRKSGLADLREGNNMLTFQDTHQQEVEMYPALNGCFYEIRIGIPQIEKLMNSFYQSTPEAFSGNPFYITPEMYAVIKQLTSTTYTGKMKALFLEAKMTELFLLQLQQKKNFGSDKSLSLKQSDKDKVYDARQWIEEHPDEFITIARLAQMAGINQKKLMQGFKAVLGCTVYQYIISQKMEAAKNLLLNSDKNVSEVGYSIGYQNPQHFITAFKRKFGITPGKLKA